jgi:hypothetical protein
MLMKPFVACSSLASDSSSFKQLPLRHCVNGPWYSTVSLRATQSCSALISDRKFNKLLYKIIRRIIEDIDPLTGCGLLS